jgi:hypothetical protein
MLFCFSLLAACPNRHHHNADCAPITTIYSFKEVDFDLIDANTLVVPTKNIKLPKTVINRLRIRHVLMHVFTSPQDLKNCFSKIGSSFNKIIFFDEKEENVNSVAKIAEDLGVVFRGYIYKGAEATDKMVCASDRSPAQ